MRLGRIVEVMGALLALAASAAACGDGFSRGPSSSTGGGGAPSDGGSPPDPEGTGGALVGAGGGGGGESDPGPSGGGESGPGPSGGGESGSGPSGGGAPTDAACGRIQDCQPSGSSCKQVACVDGACIETPLAEQTPCPDGACEQGSCVISTCSSGAQDGDESGKDCGGSCGLCPNDEGCGAPADCLSGVCEGRECLASACTDRVKNGTETGVDCGGGCALKCGQGQGCKVAADCAVAAGDLLESVRCVDQACVSTKPPSEGGVPLYWQDFAPQRLVTSTSDCGATDDVCLLGNGVHYPMFGVGPTGTNKALNKALVFTNEGVVGGGGKFDGTYCLTRAGTNLAMSARGAMTAMAWVKSTRNKAPWESAILGSPAHYLIAVDANPASQRFLAAISTTPTPDFDYRSSAATNEVTTGQWHHVAQTYDTATAQMLQYVDGRRVQATTVSGNINSTAAGAFVGCRRDGAAYSQFFVGTLDEAVLYPRALTAGELTDYVRRTAPAAEP